MQQVIIQGYTLEQLAAALKPLLQSEVKVEQPKEDLLSRKQVLELLQINASTLFHWQNKGKINVYKLANKCYYKRSEILDSLVSISEKAPNFLKDTSK